MKEEFFKNKDNVIAIIGIIFFVILAIFARFNTTSDNINNESENKVCNNCIKTLSASFKDASVVP